MGRSGSRFGLQTPDQLFLLLWWKCFRIILFQMKRSKVGRCVRLSSQLLQQRRGGGFVAERQETEASQGLPRHLTRLLKSNAPFVATRGRKKQAVDRHSHTNTWLLEELQDLFCKPQFSKIL